ncbi:protein kinase domain-containing protein [Sarocladium implicatum]|nr:protein kinase domain-containing protein [Sarocladium implicatum]
MRPSLLPGGGVPLVREPRPVPLNKRKSSSSDQAALENQENAEEILKLRHPTSNVWSEIRGAIRAIGRSKSETSIVQNQSEVTNAWDMGKGLDVPSKTDDAFMQRSLVRKVKSSRQLVQKLCQNHLATASNNAVSMKAAADPRHASVQGLFRYRQTFASSDDSNDSSTTSGSTGKVSTAAQDSTRKTSIDSRSAIAPLGALGRRNSRRHPWTRSSPEGGALGTIEEATTYPSRPSILTVENAAAAKVYIETTFHERMYKTKSRDTRRQMLESQLYFSPHLDMEQKDAVRRSYHAQETCLLRETRVLKAQSQSAGRGRPGGPYVENYEPLKVLGKGSFGVVRLVREKDRAGQEPSLSTSQHSPRPQVYAMKVIRKSDMLRSSQEGHLRAERDFLVASKASDMDRVVPLVESFQDASHLYLVMEYMPGGDFLGLLIRENVLHEAVARFYIAEMILAVEEAHRLKFIHRDIKPDNFLISASGHLKISDFGLAFDGHWSHDASYYSCHRYSLLRKLGISVDGDAVDQKESRNIHTQLKWAQTLMTGLERHEKKSKGKDEGLKHLIDWRNRNGTRAAANSVVGTSQYMAPEVVQGLKYDGRCD